MFRKTRHGYLNDDFIDDEEDENYDEEWDMSYNDDDDTPKQKKRKGRPKKIKEEEIEELQHYDDEGQTFCSNYYLSYIIQYGILQRRWRKRY